jgi:aminoglycoside 6-adenylyltransferase
VNGQDGDLVIQRLVQWAGEQRSVRAMLLTSSRANPHALVDLFSDYDVILVVTDIRPFFEDRAWLGAFGQVLVVYRDPIYVEYGCEGFAYITQYEDGLKIDFTLWPFEMLRHIVSEPLLPEFLDMGYAVLLDKDALTDGLQPPGYRAYIPTPPSEAAYQNVVELFFHEATYVAKHLWRRELMPAKYNLDQAMKQVNLRQMLEWRMEIDHGWALKPGAYGRGLKARLRPELWSELESTYVGAGMEENWDALFKTIDLFRRVGLEVAEGLGYEYPRELDRRMMVYLRHVKGRGQG